MKLDKVDKVIEAVGLGTVSDNGINPNSSRGHIVVVLKVLRGDKWHAIKFFDVAGFEKIPQEFLDKLTTKKREILVKESSHINNDITSLMSGIVNLSKGEIYSGNSSLDKMVKHFTKPLTKIYFVVTLDVQNNLEQRNLNMLNNIQLISKKEVNFGIICLKFVLG